MSAITREEWNGYSPEDQWAYVEVLEKLNSDSLRVLRAVPECPVHGVDCVPHAVEWIERMVKLSNVIEETVAEPYKAILAMEIVSNG